MAREDFTITLHNMDLFSFQYIFIALAVGILSGLIGAFVILKRMALVGDALSHVALPGIALALFYQVDPLVGVLVFLSVAAFFIWQLEEKTNLSPEVIVGILFTVSLAIGILTIPDSEILEALFGAFPLLSHFQLGLFGGAALLLVFLTLIFTKRFLFSVISPELSKIHNKGRAYDLLFFLIFTTTVALGIKLVGTLLMGALTIIPASAAKNISQSMKGYILIAAGLGGFEAVAGMLLARNFNILPGPAIILLGGAIFLISLAFVRKF